jgi:hypothetical membrane protein
MINRKKNIFVSLVGMLIPILFISLIITFGALEPGYNHMTMMLSILGGVGGIRGIIFNIAVGITGGLIILYAIGLNRAGIQSKAGLKGIFLFILGGFGLIGAAIVHCNQNCSIVLNLEPIRAFHGIFAFIASLSLTLAPLPFYFHFKQDPQTKRLAAFTLAIVILSIISAILFWIIFITNTLPDILGLVQRLEFLFLLIWIVVFSTENLLAFKGNSNKVP